MKTLIYTLALVPTLIFSQVGINTTTPLETLHVEGTFCVTNTLTSIPTKIAGINDNGLVSDMIIGNNLTLTGNVLSATDTTNDGYYYVATKSLPGSTSGTSYDDLNLDLNGLNVGKTLFRLTDRMANYQITGIAGGTDGRHIVIFNVTTSNLKFYDESAAASSSSLAENRIITLANSFVTTAGYGTAEFVYDAILQRWIMIAFRQ